MKHRLPGARTDIEHRAISVFDGALAGNLSSRKMATSDEFGIFGRGFLQSRDVFLGDDQNVRRALRIEVFEGKRVLVFKDFLGRHFTTNNATEKTIGHKLRFLVVWKSQSHAISKSMFDTKR